MRAFFLKAAVAVLAIVGVSSTKVEAQAYNPQPATVEMDPNQYNEVTNHPTQVYNLLNLGNSNFRMVDNIYRDQNVDNPGPVGSTPCVEQMTPALYNYYQSQANRYCSTYFVCVQGGNCAWWLYIFRPTDYRCQINWPAYMYSMPAEML